MRRALIALAVTALATLSLAGPAGAAGKAATTAPSTTVSATAIWETSPPAAVVHTYLSVTSTDGQAELTLESTTTDAAGHLVQTKATATEGFTFTMDTLRFTTARVTATGLPTTTCTYDDQFNELGCVEGTIALSVTWTGQGRYDQLVVVHLENSGGFTYHQRQQIRSQNDAMASGTVGDMTWTAADQMQADFSQIVTTELKRGH